MSANQDLPIRQGDNQTTSPFSLVPNRTCTSEKNAAKRASTHESRPLIPMQKERGTKIQYQIEQSSNEGSIDESRNNDLYQTTVLTDHLKLQHQSSLPLDKQNQSFQRVHSSKTELNPDLIDQLDFSFFSSVYKSYNTIWQLVLKLPIHGNSLVKKSDFVEVLKNCKIIKSEDENVFCNFLLFSCSKKKITKGLNGERIELDLLDFRSLLKSVLVSLKRQTLANNGKNKS